MTGHVVSVEAPRAPADSDPATTAREERPGFRPDIEGLRAVAVLLIVAFHVRLPGFDGGFVGVDVFFVISGFLITGILLRWLDGPRRRSLGQFWSRRVRRLVPALALVVVVTLVVGVGFVYSPLSWNELSRQAFASALYFSNVLFARDATDYFAPSVSTSPFLHTWSLGVEEQFYLLWPLLFIGPAIAARRSIERARRNLVVTLGAVTVCSFALSIVLSRRGSPWAFFSSFTRAWEFGAAGLLAAWLAWRKEAPGNQYQLPRNVAWLRWLGLALILVAAVRLNEREPYPGLVALIPVTGALLALLPTEGRSGPVALLSLPPVRWIGRVSYSWYLWHWPLIVFAGVRYRGSGTTGRLIAALIALGLADLTYRFVENPVRLHPRLKQASRSFVMGGAVTLAVLLCIGTVKVVTRSELHDPLMVKLVATRNYGRQVKCTPVDGACVYGDATASRSIVLAGDSHAGHWLPALDQVARTLDRKLIARVRGDCPLVPVNVSNSFTGRISTACAAARANTMRMIDETRPSAVIVGTFSGYRGRILDRKGKLVDEQHEFAEWRRGYATLARNLEAMNVPLVVALDDPALPIDPIECIARHRSVAPCTPTRAQALKFTGPFNEAAKAGLADAHVGVMYDPTETICTLTECRLELDGDFVFADAGHLSNAFTRSQTAVWSKVLAAAARQAQS